MLKGIDISHWQDTSVAYQDYDFVIIKATEGIHFTDPKITQHLSNVQANNKLYGFYHYARPEFNADPIKEADYFISKVKNYVGKGLFALDWEGNALKYPIHWAKLWLDRVYEMTGVRPLIYVQESEITRRDYSEIANANYGLWVAKWSKTEPKTGAWKFYAMWQYQGSPLDKDYFNGNAEQFKKYCMTSDDGIDYLPKCSKSQTSIVDYLKSVGLSGSYSYREKLAKKNGVNRYEGAYAQNVYLLELAKQGKLIRP